MIIELLCENLPRVDLSKVKGEQLYLYALQKGSSDAFDEGVRQFVEAALKAYAETVEDLQNCTGVAGITYPAALRQPAETTLEDYNGLTITVYALWKDNIVLDRYRLRRLIVEDLVWPNQDIVALDKSLNLNESTRFGPHAEDFLKHAGICFAQLENKDFKKAEAEFKDAQSSLEEFNSRLKGLRTHIANTPNVSSAFVALEEATAFASDAMQELLKGLDTVYRKLKE